MKIAYYQGCKWIGTPNSYPWAKPETKLSVQNFLIRLMLQLAAIYIHQNHLTKNKGMAWLILVVLKPLWSVDHLSYKANFLRWFPQIVYCYILYMWSSVIGQLQIVFDHEIEKELMLFIRSLPWLQYCVKKMPSFKSYARLCLQSTCQIVNNSLFLALNTGQSQKVPTHKIELELTLLMQLFSYHSYSFMLRNCHYSKDMLYFVFNQPVRSWKVHCYKNIIF